MRSGPGGPETVVAGGVDDVGLFAEDQDVEVGLGHRRQHPVASLDMQGGAHRTTNGSYGCSPPSACQPSSVTAMTSSAR